jgi:hypothetical protein
MTNPNPFNESDEAAKQRRLRSIAIAVALVAFVILVFLVTVTRMGGQVANAPHI